MDANKMRKMLDTVNRYFEESGFDQPENALGVCEECFDFVSIYSDLTGASEDDAIKFLSERLSEKAKKDRRRKVIEANHAIPKPVEVLRNGPATIVKFSDNTWSVVKLNELTDDDDPEKAFLYALVKRYIGDSKNLDGMISHVKGAHVRALHNRIKLTERGTNRFFPLFVSNYITCTEYIVTSSDSFTEKFTRVSFAVKDEIMNIDVLESKENIEKQIKEAMVYNFDITAY